MKRQSTAVDDARLKWEMKSVKRAKTAPEPKSPVAMAVEKHRPLLSKLSEAQRRRLRQRAATLFYGHEAVAPGR